MIFFIVADNLKAIEEIFVVAGGINKIESRYDIGEKFRGFSATMTTE